MGAVTVSYTEVSQEISAYALAIVLGVQSFYCFFAS